MNPRLVQTVAQTEVVHALALVGRHLGIIDAEHLGGFFHLSWTSPNGTTSVVYEGKIGRLNDDICESCRQRSEAGLRRLVISHGHHSSWQSRCPGLNRFGGAIRAGEFAFSLYGICEPADEAVMLITAFNLGLLTYIEACRIAQRSNNLVFFNIPYQTVMKQRPLIF